ncbi:MAG: hypothetical protein V4665_01290 [Patescibacteria group bacterium]
MSNHHNHPSHIHNFLNRHTAFAILILIVGCFVAGYFIGKYSTEREYGISRDRWDMSESRHYRDQGMKNWNENRFAQ